MEAADNLLAKALVALREGDDARARTMVERAARIPDDDHEETFPAAWSAHMMLVCLVTDALEDADPSDTSWLTAAERVLADAEEPARYAMRDALALEVMGVLREYEMYAAALNG